MLMEREPIYVGLDDNFDPRGEGGRNRDNAPLIDDHLDIQNMRQKISRIKQPWKASQPFSCPSASLHLEKSRYGRWVPYVFSVNNQQLSWTKAGSSKPTRSVTMVFASTEEFSSLEREYMSGQTNINLCKQRVTIYTEERMFILSAPDQGTVDSFYKSLREFLLSNLGPVEFENRDRLAKEMIPMLDFKLHEEMRAAENLIKALQDQGLMSTPSPPVKQGYLQIQSLNDPDLWKRQYFQLRSRFIEYGYTRKEQAAAFMDPKEKRKGIIHLRYASVSTEITTDPKSHEKLYGFIIHTPYINYHLRAKHEVAMNEWISVLTSKIRKSPSTGSDSGVELAELGKNIRSDDVKPLASYTKPRVEWVDHEGRKKTFKIEKPRSSVGRSSTNELRLSDKTVSRQQARFDYFADRNFVVVVDLGAGTGVKVNDESISMRALVPGDKITLGKLNLVFQGYN